MHYEKYIKILDYIQNPHYLENFIANLERFLSNKPLVEDVIMIKFLRIITLFNHNHMAKEIAKKLISEYKCRLVNIYTGMKVPVISNKKYIIHYKQDLPNSYFVIYNGKKYNFSIHFMVKQLVKKVGDVWLKI